MDSSILCYIFLNHKFKNDGMANVDKRLFVHCISNETGYIPKKKPFKTCELLRDLTAFPKVVIF